MYFLLSRTGSTMKNGRCQTVVLRKGWKRWAGPKKKRRPRASSSDSASVVATIARLAVFIVITNSLTKGVTAITAYDCSERHIKYQTIDLLEPNQCEDPVWDYHEPQNERIQVFQMDREFPVTAFTCRASKTIRVHSCGFDHMSYGYVTPVVDEEVKIDKYTCQNLIAGRNVIVEGATFKALLDGSKTLFIDPNARGNHEGRDQSFRCHDLRTFTLAGVKYENAYQEVELTVDVHRVRGMKRKDRVYFHNGMDEVYIAAALKDGRRGIMIWNVTVEECEGSNSEVYRGVAELHRHRTENKEELIKSIVMIGNANKGQYAGLIIRDGTRVCGHACYTTQIDNLVVCFTGTAKVIPATYKNHMETEKNNIASQIGHLHISTNLRMHRNFKAVISDLCKIERKVLSTRLQALATRNSQYSLLDVYGPGHTLYVSGGLAYVVKCRMVNVTRWDKYPNCTEELPVQREDRIMFADPFTWVLQEYPTIIPCSELYPAGWKIGETWFCAKRPGTFEKCNPLPDQLNVTTSNEFLANTDFTEGLNRGIYTKGMLEQERRFRLNYQSRKAVLAEVTNAAVGTASQGGVLSVGTLGVPIKGGMDRLTDHVASATQPLFTVMGGTAYYVSVVVAVCFFTKLVCGILLREITMYRERGCGWWLLGALWMSAFQILLIPKRLVVSALDEADDQLAQSEEGTMGKRKKVVWTDVCHKTCKCAYPAACPTYASIANVDGHIDETKGEVPPNAPYRGPQSELQDLRIQQEVLQDQLRALVDSINAQRGDGPKGRL